MLNVINVHKCHLKNQICFWKPGREKKTETRTIIYKEKNNLFKAWLKIQEKENIFNDKANLLAFYWDKEKFTSIPSKMWISVR